MIISCSTNIKYPLWWLRGEAEGAGLPHFNMNSVDVDSERCLAWIWIQSSQLSKVPLSPAFYSCRRCLCGIRSSSLAVWRWVSSYGDAWKGVGVGAHHRIALATATGERTIFTMFPSCPRAVPSKRLTPLTVSLERASNSLVSIWFGCDQWQKLCFNPDGLLDQRLSPCYE